MEVRVLSVLPGEMAVISTKGMRRVVIQGTEEPIAELMSPSSAEAYADGFNGGDATAIVKRYIPPAAASTA